MTPEWVAAIAGIAAAAIALAALAVTLKLYGKQSKSLQVTIDALTDEMDWRHQERERQREEAQERRTEQARQVRLEPFREWPQAGDFYFVQDAMHRVDWQKRITYRALVSNDSRGRITNVGVRCGFGNMPRTMVVDDADSASDKDVPVLAPGKSMRAYWDNNQVEELDLYVVFTDEAGVVWRLHHLHGLSEGSGEE